MTRTPLPPLAVSLGDPAGIGPEVVAKCWDHRDRLSLPPFIAIGDPRSLAAVWDGPIATIDDPREADSAFDLGLPILPLAAAQADVPGVPSVAGAHCSLDSLEIAVGLARSGSASAVVTGPVSIPFIGRVVSDWAKADQRTVIGAGRDTSAQIIGGATQRLP